MSAFANRILLAADGSDVGRLAAREAIDLAEKCGDELHVVHVGLLSQWVHPDTLSARQYQQLKDEAQKRLDAEVVELDKMGAKIAQAHLRMGRADAEIIRLSEELNVRLIVIGNRGVGAITRILLGSDAESVVRHAPCPVMVVRAPN